MPLPALYTATVNKQTGNRKQTNKRENGRPQGSPLQLTTKHTSMRKYLPLAIWFVFSLNKVQAQIDSLNYTFSDAVEQSVAANGDNPFKFDAEFEFLSDFIRQPIDLNTATQEDFSKLRLLRSEQIDALIKHRTIYSKFIALEELQTELDLNTIKKILPFITVAGDFRDFQLPMREWFRKGENTMQMRWSRRLETSFGFRYGKYLGDPNDLYLRYRYHFGQRLSYGITLQKDAGEKIWNKGVDFMSAHFYIADFNPIIKAFCLGDFGVTMGQGLIHSDGFNIGKSALVLNIEKNEPKLRQYASSNEINFMRGAGATLKISPKNNITVFASSRRLDATIKNVIVDNINETIATTLQTSGYHRTAGEMKDKNGIGLTTIGAVYEQRFTGGAINFNTEYNSYDVKVQPRTSLYNQYYFDGKTLVNFSVDYKYAYKNLHFFGETAMSDNKGWATVNGVLWSIGKKLSVNMLHRFLTKDYNSIHGQAFIESGHTQDENGIYLGASYVINKNFTVSSYADYWHYGWYRYRVNKPTSFGYEYFFNANYQKGKMLAYFQFRTKMKQENSSGKDSLKVLLNKTHTQLRFQFQKPISKGLEWRTRAEMSLFSDQITFTKGFALMEDLLWTSKNRKFHINGRVAYFNTPDYNTAIYAYENDLQNNFTVLPYYLKGWRFYANIEWQPFKKNILSVRWAQSYFPNTFLLGSGNDQIFDNKRTDVKMQWNFLF